MKPKVTDGMAKSVDPDQTAPGSALFCSDLSVPVLRKVSSILSYT